MVKPGGFEKTRKQLREAVGGGVGYKGGQY